MHAAKVGQRNAIRPKKLGKKSATPERKKSSREAEFFNSQYTDKLGISRRYGVCPRTIDAWVREKKIPHIKIGRLLRFCVPRCDDALRRFEVKEVA
jgi:hypothetical protein